MYSSLQSFSKSMELIGEITSAIYSPRLATNVGLGMLKSNYTEIGQTVLVSISAGKYLSGAVSSLPFEKVVRIKWTHRL